MYFGRRHSATVTLREVLSYRCKHCAYSSDALVVATGRGEGNSPFLLDESGAADRAMSAAEERARNELVDTLRFVRCPKCHARDETAHRTVEIKAVIYGLLVGIAVYGGMWIGGRSHTASLLNVGLSIASAILVFAITRRKWRHVDERVTFGPVRGQPDPARRPATAPPQRPRSAETDPFRAPPSTPPIAVIETTRPAAPTPVVPGDPDDKPSFLT
jgi:hypothetical protein